jgi:hypothetical protein
MVLLSLPAVLACSSAKSPSNNEPSALPGPTQAAAPATSLSADTTLVRSFVQHFYDWYAPVVHKRSDAPAWFRVLTLRDSVLTTELISAIRADSLAKEQAPPGELFGLNFDPFIAGQDPCARYEVSEIQQKGSNYGVTVHPVCNSKYKKSDFVAEVTKQGSSWRFANFFFEGTDLRKLLCQYAKEESESGSAAQVCKTP